MLPMLPMVPMVPMLFIPMLMPWFVPNALLLLRFILVFMLGPILVFMVPNGDDMGDDPPIPLFPPNMLLLLFPVMAELVPKLPKALLLLLLLLNPTAG
ncbi:MAG: hypothetical protein BYD32DRAFT_426458 [Podila humilis]|nr:MAG: hypothetical protein BYD32DRAFT_426458 [Podila humilis]